jgi:hypothetical protein
MSLQVSINNMETFNAFQLKIRLPSVAKFIKGSESLTTERKDGHIVVADTSKDILTIIAYSPANKPFLLGSGVILNFSLMVEGQGGRYALTNSEPVISDADGFNSLSAAYDGWVEIAAPQISASTGTIDFGKVSVLESSSEELVIYNNGNDDLIINQVIIGDNSFTQNRTFPLTIPAGGNKTLTCTFSATDGNDHLTTLRIRSNDIQRDPTDIVLKATSFFPNEIRVKDQTVYESSNDTIFVELFNQSGVSGFQFDIELPSNVTPVLNNIFLTTRKNDHVIVTSAITSTKIRVLAYSGSLKNFSGNDGSVLGIPILLSTGITGTFPLTISGVVISDANGKSVETGFKSGNLIVDINTGTGPDILPDNLKIYPNPIHNELKIDIKEGFIEDITLFSIDGRKIWSENKPVNPLIISTTQLYPGTYILLIKSNTGTYRKKLIKG